jgi:hypothetical protein
MDPFYPWFGKNRKVTNKLLFSRDSPLQIEHIYLSALSPLVVKFDRHIGVE